MAPPSQRLVVRLSLRSGSVVLLTRSNPLCDAALHSVEGSDTVHERAARGVLALYHVVELALKLLHLLAVNVDVMRLSVFCPLARGQGNEGHRRPTILPSRDGEGRESPCDRLPSDAKLTPKRLGSQAEPLHLDCCSVSLTTAHTRERLQRVAHPVQLGAPSTSASSQ